MAKSQVKLKQIEIASSALWQVGKQASVSLVNYGNRELKDEKMYGLPGLTHRNVSNTNITLSHLTSKDAGVV